MELPSESNKTKTFQEMSVFNKKSQETASNLERRIIVENDVQKTILKKSTPGSSGASLFKILPKGSIPLKTIQGPNGNVYLQGPQKKILSLQIKTTATTPISNTPSSSATPAVSFLPITLSKDLKVIKTSSLDLKSVPKPASTVPLTISRIAKNLSQPFTSKTFTSKCNSAEVHSVTIEKRVANVSTSSQNMSEKTKEDLKRVSPPPSLNMDTTNLEPNCIVLDTKDSECEQKPQVECYKINRDAKPKNSETRSVLERIDRTGFNNSQSLLKNKAIDKIKRSPRMKARSKSLTALRTMFDNHKKRRGSTASDVEGKNRKLIRTCSEGGKSAIFIKEDSSLLCLEKMENISPESKLYQPTSDPLANDPSPSEEIEEKVKPISPAIESSVKNSNTNDDYIRVDKNECFKAQLDGLQIIDWSHGIGMLQNSSLWLQYNEFGLIEAPDIQQIERYYKPIYEREFKSQKTSDYSDPLYLCKACNCQGAAVDFLVPDFCSHACVKRFNQKDPSIIPPKKYVNRKKVQNIYSHSVNNRSDYAEVRREPKIFDWDVYLKSNKCERAPMHLFLNPFPSGPNRFVLGMKVEAIDPENSSIFSVCTIVEKRGYRLKLHFDGYSSVYDFWVNADSMDIFPPGWCAKTNRKLQPPKGVVPSEFNWQTYFPQTRSIPAPRELFTHLNSSSNSNPFRVGMKLEADDLRNTGKVCVATVADVLDNRILVHFDGWADKYDYWISITSPYIHPVDWHRKNGFSIVPPPDFKGNFSWNTYLFVTKSIPASETMFLTREPIDFKHGMRLEVVDKRNPSLIRPATVVMTDEYEIKVLFDGWSAEYSFWVEDDSPDIHPVGWCQVTDHDLEPPPAYNDLPIRISCAIPGCRGIGNTKCPELGTHNNLSACPYELNNWQKETEKPDRLVEYKVYLESLRQGGLIQKIKRRQVNSESRTENRNKTIKLSSEAEDPNLELRINISKSLLCDYGPRLKEVHSLWKKNSECLVKNLSEIIHKNPLEWTVEEVAEFVEKIPQCQIIAQDFRQEEIDGAAFLSLRQTDLTDLMKMKLGPAIKIYNLIVQLREEALTRFLNA